MAKKIVPVNYSREDLALLQEVSIDVFKFAELAFIRHPVRGRVNFKLYPYQKKVLWYFLTRRFNIVLKFRQAGLTELIALFVLWFAMYHPNKNIQIISIKDRVAKRVLGRIKYIYKNLPVILQTPIVNGRPGDLGTNTEMEFSNGSMITSIPTTEDAGRSEAVSLLVIDEAAIVRWATKIWAAAFPTLSTGGSAIVNSCVTGDTMVIGKSRNFRMDSIAPKEFGKKDISHLGLEVLSHTGKWQKVIGSVNKGKLETWEIENRFGDRLKCTPHHKLLTSQGWKSVKEIVEKNLRVIVYKSGLDELLPLPITTPPPIEEIKPIKGFPNYAVSNLGKVYITKAGKYLEKQARPNNRKVASGKNYISISLWANNKRVKKGLHNLIAEAFIGDIPEGYVVDHLNGNPEDNYVTNLEIVSIAENTRRATLYSRGLKLGSKIGKGFPNLQLIAKIREKYKAYGKKYGVDLIIEECYRETGIKVTRAFISRIINKKRTSTVQISKLKVIRKYLDNIYDISVENDQSYITVSNYVNHNTPFGIGNWYHQTWTEALNGSNGFNPIRLKWPMHPERDLAWYNSMKAVLGPKRTAQEIDGDFLASGDSVFDLLDIKAIEDTLEDYEVERKMNGSLLIFKKAPKHVRFWIGADIASGRSRDYSTFSIMDRYGEEYACFKGKIPPDRFADLLMRMGKDYNFATIAPEGNDIGLSTVHRIQNEGYPKLYYTVRLLKEKGEKKPKQEKIPGWLTTSKNRPVILDELETDIRNDEVTIKNPFFVSEAYTFIYDERNRPVAMGKEKKRGAQDEELEDTSFSDDAIFGESITNFVRKGKVNSVVVAPA